MIVHPSMKFQLHTYESGVVALGTNSDWYSPVFWIADSFEGVPQASTLPGAGSTSIRTVWGPRISYVLNLTASGSGTVAHWECDATPAFLNPVNFRQENINLVGVYVAHGQQNTTSASGNVLKLDELRAPAPFWRLHVETAGASATFRARILAGGH